LIELIIVLAIIAIISAIAIPKFGSMQKDAKIKADVANAKNIATAVATGVSDGTITATSLDLSNATDVTNIQKYLQSIPKVQAYPAGHYYVTVTSDGTITVFINETAATGTTGGVQVYPEGATPYK
jgi:type IV pilus assembly protein PilA